MKVFRSPEEVPETFGPSVVAIGNFDGVHSGHRQIIRRVAALARARGYTPSILTFDPHPARILAPDRAPKLLMTIDQRLRAMEAEGIEAVLLLPFSLEFAKLTPAEFAESILAKTLHAGVVLVGEDFRFGYKQAGNIDTLLALGERFGFEREAIAGVARRSERISSTGISKTGHDRIRCRVPAGCWVRRLRWKVRLSRGQGIGSKQDGPRPSILRPLNEVLPKNGVYVTRTVGAGIRSACGIPLRTSVTVPRLAAMVLRSRHFCWSLWRRRTPTESR